MFLKIYTFLDGVHYLGRVGTRIAYVFFTSEIPPCIYSLFSKIIRPNNDRFILVLQQQDVPINFFSPHSTNPWTHPHAPGSHTHTFALTYYTFMHSYEIGPVISIAFTALIQHIYIYVADRPLRTTDNVRCRRPCCPCVEYYRKLGRQSREKCLRDGYMIVYE